ncbi:acyl-CoA dehydrogenase family protein [Streptomyces sp. NPDC050504]|uniref:acyl-CoA dehydrogenase family protein n=1 Tax=Streptomyces sp. NPDC050504 TaxID=3365618 RepID=UPI00378E41C8
MNDLLYSQTEEDLRAAVRSLLADHCDAARVLSWIEGGDAHDRALWSAMADTGLPGLLVPEKFGGQGATHREAAVVLEELGRAVAPVPFLTCSVVATQVLLGCDTATDAVSGLLADLAAGGTVAVLALPLGTAPDGPHVRDGAHAPTATSVADAAAADVLLVLAPDGLHAVDAHGPGVTVSPLTPLDLTRPLAEVTVARDTARTALLADPRTGRDAVRRGLAAGAGLLASEQLGIAEWCLETTVAYTKTRHQFNRPVGSFQALKHRMAQLWLEVAGTRAAARNAADALATGSAEAPLALALAQAHAAPVAVRAAEECVQLHGGLGMTWEHPAHLYLKRAKADEIAYGTPGRHRETVAELAELPAPE